MTPAEIAKLRALADAATPGPWFVREEPVSDGRAIIEDGRTSGLFPITAEWPEARFIAAARTAVPALLDEVERLRGALRALEKATRAYAAQHKVNVCGCDDCNATRSALDDARRVLGERGSE